MGHPEIEECENQALEFVPISIKAVGVGPLVGGFSTRQGVVEKTDIVVVEQAVGDSFEHCQSSIDC
jgi:hypothetical protein